MKVIVMSAEMTGGFAPSDRTAVVRILDSSRRSQKTYPRLQERLYLEIFRYVFDDITLERMSPDELDKVIRDDGRVLFDETIAEKILDDIASIEKDCETLLVHCNLGLSRSPAVAAGVMDLIERIDHALIPTPDHLKWLEEKMGVSSFLSPSRVRGFKKTTSKGLKTIYPYNEHVYETLVRVGKRKYRKSRRSGR